MDPKQSGPGVLALDRILCCPIVVIIIAGSTYSVPTQDPKLFQKACPHYLECPQIYTCQLLMGS